MTFTHPAVLALQHRNFRLLWGGLFLSFTGSYMQNAALLWHVSILAPPGRKAIALGLGNQFEKIEDYYAEANRILGRIPKVTPSSKVVGDLAVHLHHACLAVRRCGRAWRSGLGSCCWPLRG